MISQPHREFVTTHAGRRVTASTTAMMEWVAWPRLTTVATVMAATFSDAGAQLLPSAVPSGTSCGANLRGVAYANAPGTRPPLDRILVPSTADAPALCCAACDANTSCAAWTVSWNVYHTQPNPFESSCKWHLAVTHTLLPQRCSCHAVSAIQVCHAAATQSSA